MSMSDNLKLWELVERTDPTQTKLITGKPYRGTSPKPYFLIHEATKVFGPCGIGWGFTIVSERVEDGGKAGDKLHIAHVRVWYLWDDKRGEVEHIGQTMFSGTNKNGLYTDEDAPKKSVTDALVKALSMIGFAGDIFMGRYDDSKYVNDLVEDFKPAKEPSVSERYISEAATFINHCEDTAELGNWWRDKTQERADILSREQTNELRAICVARGAELKKKLVA